VVREVLPLDPPPQAVRHRRRKLPVDSGESAIVHAGPAKLRFVGIRKGRAKLAHTQGHDRRLCGAGEWQETAQHRTLGQVSCTRQHITSCSAMLDDQALVACEK
jgi:hypothetical protein